MPRNLEGYYQEIGRAGRDSMPARAILFYGLGDVFNHQQMMDGNDLTEARKRIVTQKLQRMQQFCETIHCRRRVLLNYFSEPYNDDCGNCDNCRSKRSLIDGTILAQKALSAISRVKGKESIPAVIDVLRGAKTKSMYDKGYHLLPTYGKGADLKPEQWRDYLIQLINLGLIEQAIEDNNHLKLTSLSDAVLRGGQKVDLSEVSATDASPENTWTSKKAAPKPEKLAPNLSFSERTSMPEILALELTDLIRKKRKELATEKGWPPYVIFGDKTLAEMVNFLPRSRREMLLVNGMGEKKYDLFGAIFVDLIEKFCIDNDVG